MYRRVVGVNYAVAILLAIGRASLANEMEPIGWDAGAVITNLAQLRQAAEQTPLTVRPINLVADVYDADSACGVFVLRDFSGIEFVQISAPCPKIDPGTKVCLEGIGCGVRRKGFGLVIVPGLVVENDGIHPTAVESGVVFLRAGLNPIVVQYFNQMADFSLSVEYQGPGLARRPIPSSALFTACVDPSTRKTNFISGLNYRYYEGFWPCLPNFSKLQPTRSGVATNFDIGIRRRDEGVGFEFSGFLNVPRDGFYTFYLGSDDGSRLLVGYPLLHVRVVSNSMTMDRESEEALWTSVNEAGTDWVTVEGTVGFAASLACGGEMSLRAGANDFRVEIFENCGLTPIFPPHTKVRASGIYRDTITESGSRLTGVLRVASWAAVQPTQSLGRKTSPRLDTDVTTQHVEKTASSNTAPYTLTSAAEVKELSSEVAKQQLPVRFRGVVTATLHSFVRGAVIQDSTRGVFVSFQNADLAEPMKRGELYEVEGVTSPGDFAPVVIARRIRHLGTGKLPDPIRPVWNQLFSGALDTEYVELEGVVVAARDQEIDMLAADGEITLILDEFQPEQLAGYENALVRIRGCAFALFNTQTRELNADSVRILGGAIEVVQPPPSDLFAVPQKKIGDLLLYDPNAAVLRFLKVHGQIIYSGKHEYFLTDGTNGIRVAVRNPNKCNFNVGELVDVVGFLDCGGPTLGLKKAIMRKTGRAPLPAPTTLPSENLLSRNYAGKLVKLSGRVINSWRDASEYTLELQSGFVGFKARLPGHQGVLPVLRIGSLLELTGVYVPQSSSPQDRNVNGFELLMHSPGCIRVLANPPWWTLKRALYTVGILVVLLLGVLVWNKELRRQVQERSRRLENEIRKRERVELQHAAEMERSRIARDLHDELGAGLTAISLLASVGIPNLKNGETMHNRFIAIAEKARALVEALDVIVWAVDPKRDSLQSFADYVASYAKEFLDASGIVCRLKIPIECDGVTLSGPVRHGLFLAVKEALNNIIRHAAANEVELVISLVSNRLEIAIKDNGRGFDWNLIRPGEGLGNLRDRLASLGGECLINSQLGHGTAVKLVVPLDETSSNQK